MFRVDQGQTEMLIQTLPQPNHARSCQTLAMAQTADGQAIVAAEGSELATHLRSIGWVARSGWRSHLSGRPATWFVRFECPNHPPTGAAA